MGSFGDDRPGQGEDVIAATTQPDSDATAADSADSAGFGVTDASVEVPSTRLMRSRPASRSKRRTRSDTELAKGTVVGRYILLRQLGTGGMGVVYAAYDPDLNRRVALKLMRPHVAADTSARLLREAQALARLSHPNVVALHDVGEFEHRLFLAMELVEGVTLAHWLRQAKRSWREIMPMFLAAGHGLAAAHSAGVVHRDFKPHNVLVGNDGRVRVMDFGLARAVDTAIAEPEVGVLASPDVLGDELTQTGSVLGTPRYMPPEAYIGHIVSEAGDQFSFCVAVYEAIYAELPFEKHLDPRSEARWIVRDPPPGTRVPRRIRELLIRGLAVNPRARHPSMHALIEALATDPTAMRRKLAIGAGCFAAALALGTFAVSRSHRDAQVCRGAEAKLAGVWDARVRADTERAFKRIAGPGIADTWTRVAGILDDYGSRWSAMRTDACEATRVRGEQTEQTLTLRMICLDRRREDLAALVDVIAHADNDTALRAVTAAHELPSLSRCADVAALHARVPPPDNPVLAARVDQVYQQLARARAARDLDALTKVTATAQSLRFAPLIAEAELALGRGLADRFDQARALDAFDRAVVAALAGKDERVLAEAFTSSIENASMERVAEARRSGARAEAIVERLGDEELASRVLLAEADLELRANDIAKAIELASRALSLCERRFGPNGLETAAAHRRLAGLLGSVSRAAEAEPHARKALEITRSALGPKHPDVLDALDALWVVLWRLSRWEDALSIAHERTALTQTIYGNAHDEVAHGLNMEASSLGVLGRVDAAIDVAQRAIDIARARLGPASVPVAMNRYQLGDLLVRAGKNEQALGELKQAMATVDVALRATPTPPEVALAGKVETSRVLAEAYARLGDRGSASAVLDQMLRATSGTDAAHERKRTNALVYIAFWQLKYGTPTRALEAATQARELAAHIAPGANEYVCGAAATIGAAYIALHDWRRASEQLELALKALDTTTRPRWGVFVPFHLARALDELDGGNRARAIELARQALEDRKQARIDELAQLPLPSELEIRRWLDAHPAK